MGSTPPRFAIRSADVGENEAHLTGPELHHLRDVLRLRPGDDVDLVDERGRNFSGRIALINTAAAVIRIERVQEPRSAPPLILALAIIKGPRMDLAVEKAAELGASEVWPLICARGVVRDPGSQRLARWRRLAAAACKQSLAQRQVAIKDPLNFGDVPARMPTGILPVICQADAPPLGTILQSATRSGILIACGPEGDFTPAEVAAAQQRGFVRASLGRNRLRTETAALAALAIAASVMDLLA